MCSITLTAYCHQTAKTKSVNVQRSNLNVILSVPCQTVSDLGTGHPLLPRIVADDSICLSI